MTRVSDTIFFIGLNYNPTSVLQPVMLWQPEQMLTQWNCINDYKIVFLVINCNVIAWFMFTPKIAILGACRACLGRAWVSCSCWSNHWLTLRGQ